MAAAVAVTVDPVTSDGDIDVDIDIDGDGDGDVDSLQNDTDVCPSPTEVDNLLSKEFLQLSLRDRNAISEEIHGVLTLAPKESPQLLDAALVQLSEEIDLIPDNSPIKAAYLKSQQQVCLQEELEFPNNKNKNTYVNDRNFRLRFVRCELFDAKKAAIRMLKFLDIASDIFGEIVLKRPIHLEDFTKEELKIMRFGVIQILPYRDRSGRPIFAWVGDFGLENANNRLRAKMCLYIFYSLSDDLESQRKGFTTVIFVGSNKISASLPRPSLVSDMKRMHEGLPIRSCSTHFCLPDKPYFHAIRSMVALSLGAARFRLKFHVGEETELRYMLQGYGIPVDLIPVTGTGNIKTVYFKQWLRVRKTLEALRTKQHQNNNSNSNVNGNGGKVDKPSIIECPRSNDVIFRTGTALTCHPGNSMFQSIMESKMLEHAAASQVGKMEITKEIIDEVKRKQGRFLQWDSRGWWMQLKGKSHIHAKVAVSVRDFKTKSIAQQNRQTCESSTFVFQNQDGKRRKCIV